MKNPVKDKISPKAPSTPKPTLMLMKSISDVLGNDERILMFRKVKGKNFMFVIKTKSVKKLPVKEKPMSYPLHESDNLGAVLYKINRELKAKK